MMKYQVQSEDQEQQLSYKSLSKKGSNNNFFVGKLSSREIQEYDKYQYPANFKIAEEHALATRIGRDMDMKELQNGENGYIEVEKYCQCCGYQVQKKQFDLGVETEELGFLGSGYPLFFDFMKFSFAIIFLIFITSGLYNMSSNLLGDNCQVIFSLNSKFNADIDKKNQCVSSWIMNISFANKINNSKFVQLQSIVNFSTILIIIIALQYFRKSQREINVICDEKNVTASDYALCIKFIPTNLQDVDYLAEIGQIMCELGYNIIKINLSYDLKELEKIQDELNIIMQKKITFIQKIKQKNLKKKDQQFIQEVNLLTKIQIGFKDQNDLTILSLQIEEQFQQKQKELRALLKDLDSGKSNKFIGIAILSFDTEDQRDMCYDKYKLINTRQKLRRFLGQNQENQLEILGNKVVVELAAEPNDINWQALNSSTVKKVVSRCISLIVDLVIMVGLFTLTVYIIKKQNDVKNTIEGKSQVEQEKIREQVTFIGYGVSLFTSISNYVLAQTMFYTANIEDWSTKTRLNVKLATKLALAQFMNTALLQFIISYLVTQNYYGVGGLIYNQTLVFITDFIISLTVGLINPAFIIQKILKYIYNRYDYPYLYQAQVQVLYENPEFKLSYLYAQLIKTCFFCAFYSPVIPIGTLFSMLSILSLYWINKYNLLRRSVVKEQQSAELSQDLTELIEYIIVIYSFTNLIFEFFIMKSVQATSIVGLIIGLLNAFLPMDRINLKLFPPRPDQNELLTYGQAEKHLEIDYGRSNPATKQLELLRFQSKYSFIAKPNEQSQEYQKQQ